MTKTKMKTKPKLFPSLKSKTNTWPSRPLPKAYHGPPTSQLKKMLAAIMVVEDPFVAWLNGPEVVATGGGSADRSDDDDDDASDEDMSALASTVDVSTLQCQRFNDEGWPPPPPKPEFWIHNGIFHLMIHTKGPKQGTPKCCNVLNLKTECTQCGL
jgi:hypothetical protein